NPCARINARVGFMAEATARSLDRLDGFFAPGQSLLSRIGRSLRLTLVLCALLISASLIACVLLETRQVGMGAGSETARLQHAHDIAGAAGAVLDRYARMGRVFAQSPEPYRGAELGR